MASLQNPTHPPRLFSISALTHEQQIRVLLTDLLHVMSGVEGQYIRIAVG